MNCALVPGRFMGSTAQFIAPLQTSSKGDASVPTPHTSSPAPTGTKALLKTVGTFRDDLCIHP